MPFAEALTTLQSTIDPRDSPEVHSRNPRPQNRLPPKRVSMESTTQPQVIDNASGRIGGTFQISDYFRWQIIADLRLKKS